MGALQKYGQAARGATLAGLVVVWAGVASAQVSPATITLASGPAASIASLRNLSLDQLAQVQVTSVEKRPLPLKEAPASVFVITHDDIARSGATSLPEILRMAPNLQVFEQSASDYVITARGFGGNSPDQSFSNTLLVLIDGRSVYTPIFTGVYWDMQDVPPEDIERIEVISGPAGALWGANAVNGVINIITRKSGDTQGGFVDYTNGSLGRTVTAQFGGKIDDDLTFRAYFRDITDYDTETATGAKANDEWSRPQGGLRADWTPTAADSLTFNGDYYQGDEAQDGAPNETISGRDISAHWDHDWSSGGQFDLLTYFDRTERGTDDGGGAFFVDSYDVEAQDSQPLGPHNQLVGGVGYRQDRYGITTGTSGLVFTPSRSDLDVSDIFLQDTLAVTRRLSVTAGVKAENDPFSRISPMPDVRIGWQATDATFLWAAVSRAVRSPAPFDTQLTEISGGKALLYGDAGFLPEKLTAYEAGARFQPTSRLQLSGSIYYNVYDDLRDIQLAPVTFFPLSWGNGLRGHTYGFEGWADYRVLPWWRVTAAVDVLQEALSFKPGATTLIGPYQDGDDPKHQASLRSAMDLGQYVTFDADLRYMDALPDPSVPAYVEMDARLAWKVTRRVEVAISGLNLLHAHHQELPAPADAVPRSFNLELRLGF